MLAFCVHITSIIATLLGPTFFFLFDYDQVRGCLSIQEYGIYVSSKKPLLIFDKK